MKFYKAFEYVLCVVLEQYMKGRYLVRRRGSEHTGTLICCHRALSEGEEVLCRVGDSDENGDGMVLCMEYEEYDRFKGQTITDEELEKLNQQCDIDLAEFREELDRRCREKSEKRAGG